jgi:hypothetical protein
MSRYEIGEKLGRFLSGSSNSEEAKVTYILVEIRKILDHAYDKQKEFSLLRFYCDWIVHTEKTRGLAHIAPVVQKVFDDVKTQIQQKPFSGNSAILDFIYMDGLRNEMEGLFKKEGLPLNLFQKDSWISFLATMVQILTDQPILNPIPDVSRLVLTPANPGCVCGIMEFAHPITGHDGRKHTHYDFKNVY